LPYTQVKYYAEWYDCNNRLVRLELRPESDTTITPVLMYVSGNLSIRYKVQNEELPYGLMPSYCEFAAFLKDTDLQTHLLSGTSLQVWVYYNASLFWKGWLLPVERRRALRVGIQPLNLVASDLFKLKEVSLTPTGAFTTVQSFVNEALDIIDLGFTCTVDSTMRFKDYADETVTLGDMSFFPDSMQSDFTKKTMRTYFEVLHELASSCLHNIYQESGNLVFEPSRGVGKIAFTGITRFENAVIEFSSGYKTVRIIHDIPKYPATQINADPDFERFQEKAPALNVAANLREWEHEEGIVSIGGSNPRFLRIQEQANAVQGPRQTIDFISFEPGNKIRITINAQVLDTDPFGYPEITTRNWGARYVFKIGELYLNDSLEWQSSYAERTIPDEQPSGTFTHIDEIQLPHIAGPSYFELLVPVTPDPVSYPYAFEYQFGFAQLELVPGEQNGAVLIEEAEGNAASAGVLEMKLAFNAANGANVPWFFLVPDPGSLLGRATYDVWFGLVGNTPGKSLLEFVASKLASYKNEHAVITANFMGIERIGRRLELDGYTLVQPIDVEMNLTKGTTSGMWEVV
jgi:hypothetical protein